MKRFKIDFTGTTPLIMHKDNLEYDESIKEWRKDPANKQISVTADDRSPPWTWVGYVYQNGEDLVLDADCLMTHFRDAGVKIKTGKGKETFKKLTSQIILDDIGFPLIIDGNKIPWQPIKSLIGELDFKKHKEVANDLGFELFLKRAAIGKSKHIRCRPLFRNWTCSIGLSVDPEVSGIDQKVLQQIVDIGGVLIGLLDWRPGSPSSGQFGKYSAIVSELE